MLVLKRDVIGRLISSSTLISRGLVCPGQLVPEAGVVPGEEGVAPLRNHPGVLHLLFPDTTVACQRNIVTLMDGYCVGCPDKSGTWYQRSQRSIQMLLVE